jgi:hypothetical protein
MATTGHIALVTEAYLAALTAKERAEKALEDAKAVLTEAYNEAGITETEIGEVRVAVSPRERRSFSVEKLRKAVSPTLFRKVTKSSVDTRLWDASVEKGEIDRKTIKAVVTTTAFVAVLVTPTKGAEKPVSKSSVA